jgi:hypothetical protein
LGCRDGTKCLLLCILETKSPKVAQAGLHNCIAQSGQEHTISPRLALNTEARARVEVAELPRPILNCQAAQAALELTTHHHALVDLNICVIQICRLRWS